MIPAKTSTVSNTLSGLETREFTIKVDERSFRLLIDDLYANKIRAVLRELCTNARDSHKAAGNADQPFELWLPTVLSPVLKVRDFGTSMDHDTVMEVYTQLFNSTKQTNNLEAGCLGLGSKSPFAYVDAFTARAYDGETCRVYTLSLNEEGVPVVTLHAEVESDEPRGFSVELAAQPNDHRAFADEARQVCTFLDVRPVGSEITYPEPVFAADGLVIYKTADTGFYSQMLVRMGEVVYPVDQNINRVGIDKLQHGYTAVVDVPMGSVSFATSREALQYTDETNNTLNTVIPDMMRALEETRQADLDSVDTYWKAQKARQYWRFTSYQSDTRWRGLKLDPFGTAASSLSLPITADERDCVSRIKHGAQSQLVQLSSVVGRAYPAYYYGYTGRQCYSVVGYLNPALIRYVYVQSSEKRVVRQMRRIRQHVEAHGAFPLQVADLLLTQPSGKFLSRLLRAGIPRENIINVESLPDPGPLERARVRPEGELMGCYLMRANDKPIRIANVEQVPEKYVWLELDGTNFPLFYKYNGKLAQIGSGARTSWLVIFWQALQAAYPDLLRDYALLGLSPRAVKKLKPDTDFEFSTYVPEFINEHKDEMLADLRLRHKQSLPPLRLGIPEKIKEYLTSASGYSGRFPPPLDSCMQFLPEEFSQAADDMEQVNNDIIKAKFPLLLRHGDLTEEHIMEYIEWQESKWAARAAETDTTDNGDNGRDKS